MRIEPHSEWADKNGIIVKIESSFLHRDAFYVINFKYLNGEREHQSSVMPLAEFIEKYELIKPRQQQTVTIETWVCKSALDNYFIIEEEKSFFETGGYGRQQVKLLSTMEVEID